MKFVHHKASVLMLYNHFSEHVNSFYLAFHKAQESTESVATQSDNKILYYNLKYLSSKPSLAL